MRHPSRDNAGPGIWFVTINCHDKQELFGRVVDGRMQLNSLGQIVRDCWQQVPLHFPHVIPDDFTVMPNHMHQLVRLAAPDIRLQQHRERIERFGVPVAGSLATILRSFKAASTRAIRDRVGERMIVWQSRFYDRRIWDERTLKVVRRYIADNPREWQERTCPWIRKHQAEEGASLRCRIDGTAQDTLDESLNKPHLTNLWVCGGVGRSPRV